MPPPLQMSYIFSLLEVRPLSFEVILVGGGGCFVPSPSFSCLAPFSQPTISAPAQNNRGDRRE